MNAEARPARWLPDRTPTWVDVLIGAIALVEFGGNLALLEGTNWVLVGVGFVATLVAAGPVAQSSAGGAIGEWFRAIGPHGRIAVILGFAASVWAARAVFTVPGMALTALASGVFLAVALLVALTLVRARDVDGLY